MTCQRQRRPSGGLYLESTRAEQLGVLPGEDRPVREVMDRRITFIDPSYLLREAIQSMRQEQATTLLVQDHTELYGILTEHDLASPRIKKSSATVKDVLPRQPVITCCEDDTVADALVVMQQHHVGTLPVLNEHGGVTGLLSLVDVAASVMPGAATALLHEVRTSH